MKYAIYYLFIIEKAWGSHVWKKLEKSFRGHEQNGNCQFIPKVKRPHHETIDKL